MSYVLGGQPSAPASNFSGPNQVKTKVKNASSSHVKIDLIFGVQIGNSQTNECKWISLDEDKDRFQEKSKLKNLNLLQ